MDRHALVVGVTGIQGGALADRLRGSGWTVSGLARRPADAVPGVKPIAADLLDRAGLEVALDGVDPTHVFFNSWMRQASEAENIAVNGAMLRNLLARV
jgi:uncharacterized protein YbjT (DUF2867 family)